MRIAEDSFYRIIQDTWNSTLGFQVDHALSPEFSEAGALTVGVKITGAWEGEVLLRCSLPLARLIAAAIFQVEADYAGSTEILDALSELIHIVGGNLKALLPQPVTLSLPSLPDATRSAQTTPQSQMVSRLVLMSEGHPFVITLLGAQPAAAKGKLPVD
jgi:hypothetical protein